jgi:hypothetical protein
MKIGECERRCGMEWVEKKSEVLDGIVERHPRMAVAVAQAKEAVDACIDRFVDDVEAHLPEDDVIQAVGFFDMQDAVAMLRELAIVLASGVTAKGTWMEGPMDEHSLRFMIRRGEEME